MDDALRTDRMRELEDDVRTARNEVATTVDEIAGWFDPKARMSSAMDRGRRLVRDATDSSAAPEARRRARVMLGTGAAVLTVTLARVVRRITRH